MIYFLLLLFIFRLCRTINAINITNTTDIKNQIIPCGEIMSSYNGIPAYSNGEYQGTGYSCSDWSSTGLQFQCVEYTQRYMNTLYGIAPVWPVDFAYEMCESYPSGITPVNYPSEGFGVVFNWFPYGHTAIVTGFNDNIINVIEQNGSPSGTATYYQSSVLCYLAPYYQKQNNTI